MSTESVNPTGMQTNQCSHSSLASSEKKTFHKAAQSCKSMESVYSHSAASSSKQSGCSLNMYKRKPHRTPGSVAPISEVRQRVVSARMHRIRNVQNQLSDAQLHISELINENRLLRTLHKRQDVALSKYESTNADLPQLLHAHAEEIRMWQARVRNLQTQNKDLAQKLKQKDTVMQGLSDQNRHFQQLNNDRNLDEREKLSDRVAFLEIRLQEKDEEMKVAARRTQLESKSLKSQLLAEQSKLREILHKLESHEIYSTDNPSFKSSRSSLPIPKVNKLINNSTRPSMTKMKNPNHPMYNTPQVPKDSNATTSSSDSQEGASVPRNQKIFSNGLNVSNSQIKERPSSYVLNGDLTSKIRYGMDDLKLSDDTSTSNLEENAIEDEETVEMEKAAETEKGINSEDEAEPDDWDEDASEGEEEDEEDEEEVENEDDETVIHEEETDASDNESWRSAPPTAEPEIVSPIEAIRKNNRIDIVRRDTYLETLCENLETDAKLADLDLSSGDGPNKHCSSNLSTQRSLGVSMAATRTATGIPRRKAIDPKKKTQLLQALRGLDSN